MHELQREQLVNLNRVVGASLQMTVDNLLDACAHLRGDAVLRDWFGNTGTEDYVDYFAKIKKAEFKAAHEQITQWELDRYLSIL